MSCAVVHHRFKQVEKALTLVGRDLAVETRGTRFN
jgi:hypothetical protein